MIKLINLIAITAAVTAAAGETVPVYYLIRHAEKNADGTISAQGRQREQCLVKLFSRNSKYNIQHIMVQTPYPGDSAQDHTTQRPYNTTLPLAESLGIRIDHPCNYTDTSCAGQAALSYTGPGNVLIAWEHQHLPAVAEAIGGQDVPSYPGENEPYWRRLLVSLTSC
ncbi:phosphoglycerate mutase family protein, putative [Metarhizium acridum CQMa 102]|uniref:Phosphoglycerate mutase family protein, putative n=1 Tax=Metarhizium acridum (strain CQMa 102) TaxID=655827 RepID=E9EAB0_METAQ|nr:phosphoglycerate mutase family protein, putative [Metarhizium acridum CQMa 102]EFY87131.1 phosphoglycerate mutase family protein, putative [Metarhizium acridum CQMa 102]